MLPDTYIKTVNDFRAYYHAMENGVKQDAMNREIAIRKQHEDAEEKITKITNEFLRTGVFFLTSQWDSVPRTQRAHGGHYTAPITMYCRELAKSLKRPFVRVFTSYNKLIIPKQKRLDVLTTPFIFSSKKVNHLYEAHYDEGVFEISNYASLREFAFQGEQGKQFYETWLEYIKSPECRAALKVTA